MEVNSLSSMEDSGGEYGRSRNKKEKKLEQKLMKKMEQSQKKEEKKEERKEKKDRKLEEKMKRKLEKEQKKLQKKGRGYSDAGTSDGDRFDGKFGEFAALRQETELQLTAHAQNDGESASAEAFHDSVEIEDTFLNTLVESTQLETAVKAVFEANKENNSLQNLDNFIKKKEADIEYICNWNYQAFIKAVDELLKMKKETSNLKESIIGMNNDFQKSGKEVLYKFKRLHQYKIMRRNMSLTLEVIRDCQFLVQLIVTLNDHISKRAFYPAIKILEQLETAHIPAASYFSFVKYFERTLPNLKERIRAGATLDFNNWLLDLTTHCAEIGQFAMDQMDSQMKLEDALRFSNKATHELIATAESRMNECRTPKVDRLSSSPSPSSSPSRLSPRSTSEYASIIQESLFDNKRYKIDFTPLYQCVHVHKSLGLEEQFQNYYRENRKLQANMVLKLKEGMSAASLKGYKSYFYNIAGFFIVEQSVLATTKNLVPPSVVDKLWEMAVAKIKVVLQEQITYTLQPTGLIEIKNFLHLFAQTLQSYSYNVSALIDFFDNVKETFGDHLINNYQKMFIRALDDEKWEQLKISDLKDYDSLIADNKLQTPVNRSVPQAFEFSRIVPTYCSLVKLFVTDFYNFGKNVPDVDDFIKKVTEKLLGNFNHVWITHLEHSQSISELIQSWINFTYLYEVRTDWEEFMSKLSYHGKVKLSTQLEDQKSQVEVLLCNIIQKRVHDRVDAAKSTINWVPSSLPSKLEPREYIIGAVSFLESVFSQLKPLPLNVQENVHTQSLRAVVDAITGLMTGDDVTRFNSAALKYLDVDLKYLEQFALRTKVLNSKELFGELKQLIDLLLSENMEDFLDPLKRSQKFKKLNNPAKLLHILDKFKEESRFSLKRTGNKGKDAVMAYLKQEING